MKQQNVLTYFQANMSQHGSYLQLSSMEELIRYITYSHINTIFVLKKDEGRYFACMQQGILISYPSLGFNSIEDYKEAIKGGFPDAALFYEAKNGGYASYKDYQLVKEAGISDITTFENIKSQGYLDGYQAFKVLQDEKPLFEGSEAIENPYMLYKYASSKAFTNYHHFKTALDLGFTDAHHYQSAIEKGFKNRLDYEDGLHKGFATGEIYYAALDKKIRDIEDLQRFSELTQLEIAASNYDERLLLSVISKLPQGKKVSINKLNELFFKTLDMYRYADTQALPEWLTRSLFSIQDITDFLTTKDYAKKFGIYDTEGEYFETKQLNQRKVVMDGSNVAHGTMGNDKGKPMVGNMIKVVNKLISKGFTAITIIADASLRHKLTDMERMEELEKICEYRMAPAETAADVFLIEFVKMEGCLLVTNDTFREWKLKDKWVAENIDYYKMAFMIEGDKVLMPDLDTEVA
jgi:Zc3h12a-like Ribonuclease NYN domain